VILSLVVDKDAHGLLVFLNGVDQLPDIFAVVQQAALLQRNLRGLANAFYSHFHFVVKDILSGPDVEIADP